MGRCPRHAGPIRWRSVEARLKGSKPSDKVLDYGFLKSASMAAAGRTDVKVFRNLWTTCAKVEEIVAQDDTINLCVVIDVVLVRTPIP